MKLPVSSDSPKPGLMESEGVMKTHFVFFAFLWSGLAWGGPTYILENLELKLTLIVHDQAQNEREVFAILGEKIYTVPLELDLNGTPSYRLPGSRVRLSLDLPHRAILSAQDRVMLRPRKGDLLFRHQVWLRELQQNRADRKSFSQIDARQLERLIDLRALRQVASSVDVKPLLLGTLRNSSGQVFITIDATSPLASALVGPSALQQRYFFGHDHELFELVSLDALPATDETGSEVEVPQFGVFRMKVPHDFSQDTARGFPLLGWVQHQNHFKIANIHPALLAQVNGISSSVFEPLGKQQLEALQDRLLIPGEYRFHTLNSQLRHPNLWIRNHSTGEDLYMDSGLYAPGPSTLRARMRPFAQTGAQWTDVGIQEVAEVIDGLITWIVLSNHDVVMIPRPILQNYPNNPHVIQDLNALIENRIPALRVAYPNYSQLPFPIMGRWDEHSRRYRFFPVISRLMDVETDLRPLGVVDGDVLPRFEPECHRLLIGENNHWVEL